MIFDVTIHDLPKYQEHMAKIKPVIEASGGRYLARSGLVVESQQVVPVEAESGGWRLSCQAGVRSMPVVAV